MDIVVQEVSIGSVDWWFWLYVIAASIICFGILILEGMYNTTPAAGASKFEKTMHRIMNYKGTSTTHNVAGAAAKKMMIVIGICIAVHFLYYRAVWIGTFRAGIVCIIVGFIAHDLASWTKYFARTMFSLAAVFIVMAFVFAIEPSTWYPKWFNDFVVRRQIEAGLLVVVTPAEGTVDSNQDAKLASLQAQLNTALEANKSIAPTTLPPLLNKPLGTVVSPVTPSAGPVSNAPEPAKVQTVDTAPPYVPSLDSKGKWNKEDMEFLMVPLDGVSEIRTASFDCPYDQNLYLQKLYFQCKLVIFWYKSLDDKNPTRWEVSPDTAVHFGDNKYFAIALNDPAAKEKALQADPSATSLVGVRWGWIRKDLVK